MAVAEQLDLSTEAGIAHAFFALRGLVGGERPEDGVHTAVEGARKYVVAVLEHRDASLSAVAREQLRQLTWIANDAGADARELTECVAEWDRQLALALSAGITRLARERDEAEQLTLTARVLEQLANGPMRPADIAEQLGVNRAQTSRALAQLTKHGVVHAVQRPELDGRGKWYSATRTPEARTA